MHTSCWQLWCLLVFVFVVPPSLRAERWGQLVKSWKYVWQTFHWFLFLRNQKEKKKKNPESRKSSVSDCDGLDFQKSHSGCILTWILDRMKNRQRFNSLCVKSSNWKPLYTTLSSSPLARRLRHSGHRPRSWRSTVLKTLPLSPPDHSDRYLKKFSKGVLDCSWRLNLQEGSQVALPLSLM